MPASPMLLTASPNPFNSATEFEFKLAKTSDVTLKIYDITGRKVITIVDEQLDAGAHSFIWRADEPSGIYLARLSVGDESVARKILLAK